jgi:tetratricopeptide (TPR) repeat protein
LDIAHPDGTASLWSELIASRQDDPQAFCDAAVALRDGGHAEAAEAAIVYARSRFPTAPNVWIVWADLAGRQQDWPEAVLRWAEFRAAFPKNPYGYVHGAQALERIGQLDRANEILTEGSRQASHDLWPLSVWAYFAQHNLDADETLRRWAVVRERVPGHSVGYVGAATALRGVARYAEAEAMLAGALARFPIDSGPVIEYAVVAQTQADWAEAARRWEVVRTRFPDHPAGYTHGAIALRNAAQLDEAEALLRQAIAFMPSDPSPAIEYAWAAATRRDWPEVARRWEFVRTKFPDHVGGYTGGATALREMKRFEEAGALLKIAMERFPRDAAPLIENAWLNVHARDWTEADRLWADLRRRFPDFVQGFSGGAFALRELQRFEEADALLSAGMARFPKDLSLLIDRAWLAQVARDWSAAVEQWRLVRAKAPDNIHGYVQGARALQALWRHDEAEQLLLMAIDRFPDNAEPAVTHAWIAHEQNRWEDASARFARLRTRFPNVPDGWRGGALVLRNLFQLPEAESLLRDAIERFPDEPRFVLEHAQIPAAAVFAHQKDWPEALRRMENLRVAFPAFEHGYLVGARLLREANKRLEAEALVGAGLEVLPDSYELSIQHATLAEDRANWPEAIARFTHLKTQFADRPAGDVGLARALAGAGRYAEAEAMLQGAMRRYSKSPVPFAEYARLAVEQENWAEALRRWTDAQQRFPQEKEFAHRLFDVQMRVSEADLSVAERAALAILAPAPQPDPNSTDPLVRDLVMHFESLGGRGLGCEFGIFQRDCGAEPLGLLRWADMPYDKLIDALDSRFEGVGSEEHTQLFVESVGGGRGEYCTRDRRGMMFMRAFVYEDQSPFDKMFASACRRLRFLARKLMEDLEQGTKILVFRVTDRDLTEDEIDRLHAAVRRYGDNTLLYVRYEDAAHPNGTVELSKPGLLIGYMDRFKMARTGELSAAPPTASWLAVCRNAFSLWDGHGATATGGYGATATGGHGATATG